MSFFEFPHTRTYDTDLGWLIEAMKSLENAFEEFKALNTITFADPILHRITSEYPKNTIVLDASGNAYISLDVVPSGIKLDNENYWMIIFNFERFREKVNKNFTVRYYRNKYIAEGNILEGDWLTVDDVLYKAIAAINDGDEIIIGTNIEYFTIEDFIKDFITTATNLINQYKNDIDASELEYRQQLAQDIQTTVSSLQAQLDIAISGVTVDSEVINARIGADNVTYSTLGEAVRTQFNNCVDTDNSIKNKNNIALHPVYVANKNLNSLGKYVSSGDDRMACPQFLDIRGSEGIEYTIDSGYKANFCFYSTNAEGSLVAQRVWVTDSGRFENIGDYLRVGMANSTDTTITPAEGSHMSITIDYPLMEEVNNNTVLNSGIINSLNDEEFNVPLKFYQGSGASFTWTRIKTDLIDISNVEKFSISVDSGIQYYLGYYSADGSYVVGRGWIDTDGEYIPESDRLMLLVAYIDSSTITPADYNETMVSMKAKYTLSGVPTYWNMALNSAISNINNNECDSDCQGDSFVFITDVHWTQNAQKSPRLIKEIIKNTNIDKVFFGGDVLTLYPTKADALKVGRDFFKEFSDRDIKVFSTLGNHDVNNNSPDYGSSSYLNYPEVYSYMFKKMEPSVSGMPKYGDTNGDVNRNFYSYLDNETQKIRYIILNNGRARIGSVQKQWLQDRITELTSGWTVIVFFHRYWIGLDSDDNPIIDGDYGTDIVNAIDEIYGTFNATIAALIVGHTHYDYSIITTNGYPVIATTTDAYQLSNQSISPVMTLGTDTEQAFDVFSIDTTNRTIKATRVGAGSNRNWTY